MPSSRERSRDVCGMSEENRKRSLSLSKDKNAASVTRCFGLCSPVSNLIYLATSLKCNSHSITFTHWDLTNVFLPLTWYVKVIFLSDGERGRKSKKHVAES